MVRTLLWGGGHRQALDVTGFPGVTACPGVATSQLLVYLLPLVLPFRSLAQGGLHLLA